MSISKDLFLAILSMDSYNRGYGAGLSDDGKDDTDGLGTTNATIGSASILDIDIPTGSEAAGFYAISYSVDAGAWKGLNEDTTVISYRGTDFDPSPDFWSDVVNGWAFGAGDFRAPQLELSSQFLESVAKNGGTAVNQAFAQGIILTGHSLGGGLAGVNSRLYGQEAVVFDSEPYKYATDLLKEYYAREPGLFDGYLVAQPLQFLQQTRRDLSYLKGLSGPLSESQFISKEFAIQEAKRIYNEALSGKTTAELEANGFQFADGITTGYYLPGEILSEISYNNYLGINFARGNNYPNVIPTGETTGGTNANHAPRADGGISLHGMGALVLQMFSDKLIVDGQSASKWWLPIHKEVFGALFTDVVAKSIAPADLTKFPEGFGAGTVNALIAYSALDEGTLIFGDTGIRAMFDDLIDLGKAVDQQGVSSFFEEFSYEDVNDGGNIYNTNYNVKDHLAQIAVQYAVALALNRVVGLRAFVATEATANDGVLTLNEAKDVLALDLSSVLWGEVLRSGDTDFTGVMDAIQESKFRDAYFGQAPSSNFASGGQTQRSLLAQQVWGAADDRIFDRLHMRVLSDVVEVDLANRSYLDSETQGNGVHVDVYIGNQTRANTIYDSAGNDLIIGGGLASVNSRLYGQEAVVFDRLAA